MSRGFPDPPIFPQTTPSRRLPPRQTPRWAILNFSVGKLVWRVTVTVVICPDGNSQERTLSSGNCREGSPAEENCPDVNCLGRSCIQELQPYVSLTHILLKCVCQPGNLKCTDIKERTSFPPDEHTTSVSNLPSHLSTLWHQLFQAGPATDIWRSSLKSLCQILRPLPEHVS